LKFKEIADMKTAILAAGLLAVMGSVLSAAEVEVAPLVKTIKAVGPKGEGNVAAAKAWKELTQAGAEQLPALLAGMDGANVIAENYLRAAVDTVAQRTVQAGESLPVKDLKAFLADRKHAPRARRAAFEWIVRVEPKSRDALIASMLDDPSLELRREAVAAKLEEAAALAKSEDKKATIAAYRTALTGARDLDQIKAADKALEDLGVEVDLPREMGFVLRWRVIGPFDNVDMKGFDVAYDPEQEIDFSAEYAGTTGPVQWKSHTEKEEYGLVDLNTVVGKHKGAIVYAATEFISDEEREVDIRFGCINANKLWLNGKLLTANEVYHANDGVDQYKGVGTLKKGKNIILLKVCQNEQTENWAQDWEFQLRVCDQYGTAVISEDRQSKE